MSLITVSRFPLSGLIHGAEAGVACNETGTQGSALPIWQNQRADDSPEGGGDVTLVEFRGVSGGCISDG
jgi:hypothetical protein